MKTTLPSPTLTKAQIWARLRQCETYRDGYGDERREIPDDLNDAILALHCCPFCASQVEQHSLLTMRYYPESAHENAGYQCYNCEEFFPSGNLYEYGPDPDEWRGDADSGL